MKQFPGTIINEISFKMFCPVATFTVTFSELSFVIVTDFVSIAGFFKEIVLAIAPVTAKKV